MAKKAKKPQPVQMKKDDGNVIYIKLGLPKVRGIIAKKGGLHHTRTLDLAKGRSRKNKHKTVVCNRKGE